MSDLSRLLGDVYHSEFDGAGETAAAPVDETWSQEQVDMLAPDTDDEVAPEQTIDDEWSQAEADRLASEPLSPDWSDDDTLDEAFADWAPDDATTTDEVEYYIEDDADQFELAEGDELDYVDDVEIDQFEIEDDAFAPDTTAVEVTDIDWTTEEHGFPMEPAAEAGPWRRSDDDLLPGSGGRRRSRKKG